MIAAIVTYTPANGKSAAEITESFSAAAPLFEGMPGLIRKYFCFDDAALQGISVYIWRDRESAEACFGSPEFLARFRGTFGCDPSIRYSDIKLVVEGTNA